MSEEWLIDGYNLLHYLSRSKSFAHLSKDVLLHLLASFAQTNQTRVLVVFDGKGNDEELETYRTNFLSVMYSQSDSADTVIERRLCQRKDPAMIVVTKDRAILRMARGVGSRGFEPAHFMEALADTAKQSRQVLNQHEGNARGFHRPFEKKLKGK